MSRKVFGMSQEHVVQKLMMYTAMQDGNTVEQKTINIVIKDLVIFLFLASALRLKSLRFIVSQFFTWLCIVFAIDLAEATKIAKTAMADVLLKTNMKT